MIDHPSPSKTSSQCPIPCHSKSPVPGPVSQICAVPFIDRSGRSPSVRPMTDGQRGTKACTQPKENASQSMDQMSGCCTCNLPAVSGIGWVGCSRQGRLTGWDSKVASKAPILRRCDGADAGWCVIVCVCVRTEAQYLDTARLPRLHSVTRYLGSWLRSPRSISV